MARNPWDKVENFRELVESSEGDGEIIVDIFESPLPDTKPRKASKSARPVEDPPLENPETVSIAMKDEDWDQSLNPRQRRFLTLYAELSSIKKCCKAMKLSPKSHWEWMRNEVYEAEFNKAQIMANDDLEAAARARAIAGSDSLMTFMLKGAMPEKYGDTIKIKRQLEKLTDEELDATIKSGDVNGNVGAPSQGD